MPRGKLSGRNCWEIVDFRELEVMIGPLVKPVIKKPKTGIGILSLFSHFIVKHDRLYCVVKSPSRYS